MDGGQNIMGVPITVAREHRVFPLAREGDTLTLLAADADDSTRDKVAFILNTRVELVETPEHEIHARIQRFCDASNTASMAAASPKGREKGARVERVRTRLGVTDLVDLSSEPNDDSSIGGNFFSRLWRRFVLLRFAAKIASRVRETDPSRPSGLYEHESYIEEIGRRISARFGLQGMQEVLLIVERRKGRGVTSELGRIWRAVEGWSF